MATFSKTIKVGVSGGGEPFEVEKSYAGGSNPRLTETIALSATDLELAFAMLLTGLQLLVITATTAMTIKTNSSSAPSNTLVLVANVPYVWRIDGYNINLITVAITKLFVTNGAVAGELRIEAIADATPPA